MNKRILIALALCAPFLIESKAAQGFLGERYLHIDGGLEQLEYDEPDNGWGAGAELNIPIPMDSINYGADGNIRFSYADALNRNVWTVEALLRIYMMPGPDGFTPYAGAGIAWADLYVADASYVPLEGGVEFSIGPLGIMPFYRYLYTLSSTVDDFWSTGLRTLYWLGNDWGITGSVTYTDYGDLTSNDHSTTGVGVRLGITRSF